MKFKGVEEEISNRFRVPAPTLSSSLGRSSRVTFTRLQCDAPDHQKTSSLPSEDTYVLHIMLRDLSSSQLWYHNKERRVPHVPTAGFFLFHYPTNPVAAFHSSFDILRFCINKSTIDDLAYEYGLRPPEALRCHDPGEPDPVLYHLARSVLPFFSHAHCADQLVVDHVGLAFHARIISAYAGVVPPARRRSGGLAPWQERRAKEMMMANLGRDVTLMELAEACDISVSHFSRAFRATTGRPPHNWLLEQRVEAAKIRLSGASGNIEMIARSCGFSDASHLSRVFTRMTGEPPGAWRRSARI